MLKIKTANSIWLLAVSILYTASIIEKSFTYFIIGNQLLIIILLINVLHKEKVGDSNEH